MRGGLGLFLLEDPLGLRGGLGLGKVTTGLGLLFLLEDPLGLRGGLGLGKVTIGLGLLFLDDLLLLRVVLGLVVGLAFADGTDDEDEEELECQESILFGFGVNGDRNVSAPEV